MNSGSSQQGARASKKVDAESRVSEWQQNSGIDVDHRPLWGTVMKASVYHSFMWIVCWMHRPCAHL